MTLRSDGYGKHLLALRHQPMCGVDIQRIPALLLTQHVEDVNCENCLRFYAAYLFVAGLTR
jgi:hypothetical protein